MRTGSLRGKGNSLHVTPGNDTVRQRQAQSRLSQAVSGK